MSIVDLPVIREFLKRHANHTDARRPVAIFDCDGTAIKGDIGEAMFYYQIEQFLFRTSPADIWTDHPRRGEMGTLYAELLHTDPEKRPGTPAFASFAGILLSWYFDRIRDGHVEQACVDIVRLFAGYSPDEVRGIADATFHREISAPITERSLGGRTLPRGIRFIRETVELARTLADAGFEIWAVSGSSTWSVQAVFRKLGIPDARVIGIELNDAGGLFTDSVRVPVPIRKKKVLAFQERVHRVPVLVASDSKNDIPLLMYSADLKIYVNSRGRSTDDFFAMAGVVRDDTWLVIEHPTIETQEMSSWQTLQ